MMEQRPHVLYITHLIRKGHGYPFWYPEPDSSRSAAYTERGIHPGDVGILNDIGGFSYLFNIFCDADDPVNNGNVPPDFQPLRPPNSEPLLVMPGCYRDNITSVDVNYTEISAGMSADATGLAQAGASFEFSTTKESAAILCLPNSATKHENLNKGAIKEYATANGAAWYNYVNGSQYLARDAPNGSLYVVTGCDITDSWGTAAVRKPSHSRSLCLSFTAAGVVGGEVRAGHIWSAGSSVDTRVYPLPSARYPYPVDRENQCIFARGFTISLSDNLFKSDRKIVLKNISGSLKDKVPSFDNRAPPQLSGEAASSARPSYFRPLMSWMSHGTSSETDNKDDAAGWVSDMDIDSEASISEFPPRDNVLMNPSAAMNSYLLEKDPSLDIIVTHDEEWMEIMRKFGVDADTTDESLWSRIRDELNKRLLSTTTYSIRLSQVHAPHDQGSDDQFDNLTALSSFSASSAIDRSMSSSPGLSGATGDPRILPATSWVPGPSPEGMNEALDWPVGHRQPLMLPSQSSIHNRFKPPFYDSSEADISAMVYHNYRNESSQPSSFTSPSFVDPHGQYETLPVHPPSSSPGSPNPTPLEEEIRNLRRRVKELERKSEQDKQSIRVLQNELNSNSSSRLSTSPSFQESWRLRTEARQRQLCSPNRAGNALCAWHDARRERRVHPPRLAPPGFLNCGCSFEEALFEESLSRHGVGSYLPGENVRMDPALRNPLLKLLQERYGYRDGDFDRDPLTGDWVIRGDSAEWEQPTHTGVTDHRRPQGRPQSSMNEMGQVTLVGNTSMRSNDLIATTPPVV